MSELLDYDVAESELVEIDLANLVPSRYQRRRIFNNVDELADSIEQGSLVSPITVRQLKSDRFELVTGERRFRAFQLLGRQAIPAIIKVYTGSGAEEKYAVETAVENTQREDPTIVEEAQHYQMLNDEFGWTHEIIAKKIGLSRSEITNKMRLLKLPKYIHDALEIKDNGFEQGHAKVLLPLVDMDRALQDQFNLCRRYEWSVRVLEEKVSSILGMMKSRVKRNKTEPKDSDVKALEDRISKVWGAQVKIDWKGRGKVNKMSLTFSTPEELDGIVEKVEQAMEKQ